MASPNPPTLPARLRTEIRAALRARIDASYRIQDVVATKGEVLGVRVPAIREEVKEFRAGHPGLSVDDVVSLLDLAFPEQVREEVLFGTFLLAAYRRRLATTLWPHIDGWIDSIDNWETCDQLAMNVAGELVVQDRSLVDDLVRWARSPNPWRRRFAIAATTALNQKGRAFPHDALRVLEPALGETEPGVQKALGWALREACKHDEEATFQLLLAHRGRCARRVLREGSEKMSAAHRDRLLA